jgi:hypothetical protein
MLNRGGEREEPELVLGEREAKNREKNANGEESETERDAVQIFSKIFLLPVLFSSFFLSFSSSLQAANGVFIGDEGMHIVCYGLCILQKSEGCSTVQGAVAGLFLHCSGVGTVQGHAQCRDMHNLCGKNTL